MPCTDADAQYIELIYQKGITSGCSVSPMQFCPELALTRAQMSVMVVLAYKPNGWVAPACQGLFTDVTCGGPYANYAPYIETMYQDHVTTGCNTTPLQFCPGNMVGEWEMLVWLATVPGTGSGVSWAAYHPVPRGSTYTFRDGENRVVAEASDAASGTGSAQVTFTRDNMFLGSLLVGSWDNTGGIAIPQTAADWWFSVSDHLGSPRYLFNKALTKTETHKYWPYGEDTSVTPPTQKLAFALMERNDGAVRFYDHARHHDYNLGRFVSPDRIGGHARDPQSWNRYTYTRSNPLKLIDPNGLEVIYADEHLRGLFTSLSARLPQVRQTLARYTGPGQPDLVIQRGNAGLDQLTGEKSRGAFEPVIERSYKKGEGFTVSDPMARDQFPATGKNITGAQLKSATITIDNSVPPGSKYEANVAGHETGHAEDAAKDPMEYERNTADDMTHDANSNALAHDDRPEEQKAIGYRNTACGANTDCPQFPPR